MSIDLIALHHSNKGETLLEKHDAATKPEVQSSLWSRATRTRGRKIALAATAAFAALGLTAGTVSALTTSRSAGSVVSQVFVSNDAATTAIGTSWTSVLAGSVVVPSGTTRILAADYTAETQCLGTSGYCSARIGYIKAGTSTFVPMVPNQGADFALDSPGGDTNGSWEGHAMSRSSARVGAGTYRVYVQVAKVGAGVSQYRLDEQHLRVSANS